MANIAVGLGEAFKAGAGLFLLVGGDVLRTVGLEGLCKVGGDSMATGVTPETGAFGAAGLVPADLGDDSIGVCAG